MAEKYPSNDMFNRLPEELHIQILKLSPDLPCLWNLVQASPALHGVLGRYPIEILETMLYRSVHEQILPIVRAVFWSHISYFPLSLDASRRIAESDSLTTTQSEVSLPEDSLPGGAETTERVRSFLATADNIHTWSHVCLDRLIRRSVELRPSTLDRCPPNLWHDPEVLRQAVAESQRYLPLITGPPSPMEERRMLRAFWLLQLFLELRGAGAGGRLDRWWSKQHLDMLLTSSVGDFFELHGSTQQQLLTVHDFLSATSATTDSGIVPCVEKPAFVIGEDRPRGLYPDSLMNGAWLFHFWMTQRGVVPKSFLGSFEPFRKFGFAIWDDQRMIDLGFMTSRGNYFRDRLFYCFRWRSVVTEAEITEH